MKLLLRWILNAIALWLVMKLVPGFTIDSFGTAMVVALMLGIVNVVIRPIILLLTLPINILSLGLFTFIVNAAMILLVQNIVKGFNVAGWGPAIWGAIILWLINWLATSMTRPETRVLHHIHQ